MNSRTANMSDNKLLGSITLRTFALFLVVIQSIGIRFFDAQGSLLLVAILGLSWKGLLRFSQRDAKWLAIIFGFLILNKAVNERFTVSALIFQMGLVLETFVFLNQYENIGEVKKDLMLVLKFIFLNAIIGYVILTASGSLFGSATFAGMSYKSFLSLFFVSDAAGGQFGRNTGLLWEPGLLQYVLNMYLFFCIQERKQPMYLGLIVLTIVSTFSTAGYLILVINAIYYFLKRFDARSLIFAIPVGILCILLFNNYLSNTISEKFDDNNSSGVIRMRDAMIGYDLIQEKPILGHGKFEASYLESNAHAANIENTLFSSEFLDINGSISGGYTDGLLGLFAWYGIPAGLFILYCFFRNTFVSGKFYEKLIFFLISCLSFISEPITYTSFFLLFPMSLLIFSAIPEEQYQPI